MDYPLRKMTIFVDLLKLQFSGLKFILFYPEYQETIFWNIITSKTLIRKSLNFGQKPWTNLLGKDRFFWPSSERYLSALKIILFYPKYQKYIFSDLIIPKNPNEKKFDVSTKNHGLSP